MRKSPEKKPITKNNLSKQHRAGKDNSVPAKKTKPVRRKTTIKKATPISPILSGSKDKRGKRLRAANKRTPHPEESAASEPIQAPAEIQIEETPVMLPDSGTFERQGKACVREMTRFETDWLGQKATATAVEESIMMSAEPSVQLQEGLKIRAQSEKAAGMRDCRPKTEISENHPVRIHSGRRLCPAWLMGLSEAVDTLEVQGNTCVEEMTRFETDLPEQKATATDVKESIMMSAEPSVQLREILKIQLRSEAETDACDCCPKTEASEDHLVRIDSYLRPCRAWLGTMREAFDFAAKIFGRLRRLLPILFRTYWSRLAAKFHVWDYMHQKSSEGAGSHQQSSDDTQKCSTKRKTGISEKSRLLRHSASCVQGSDLL
jgi:hypothetical protein